MTVFLLLAAGNSSRMGKPKMLLPFNGKTLLQHSINEIKKISDQKLLVITGCYHSLLKEQLQQQQILFFQNEHWQEGMASSIGAGMKYILQYFPGAANVMILVCDQPFISAGLFQQMITKKSQLTKGIIACRYNDTTGVPVLFDKKYFARLAILKGDFGAKKLVQQFVEDTAVIDFPEGATDIDTPEDYEKFIKNTQ